ncbi:MAG: phospholipase D-like domain-containing protein [Methanomicrobiaceae archaeon]|nr:phospholipase D-like domain-containing protein [Methanomicrobiaceae archaeon]
MRYACLLMVALLLPAASALQITEFCPDTYLKGEADEYFILEGTGSLTGVTIRDGEGSIRFPTGASIDASLVIARDGEAYRCVHGVSPDYELFDTSAAVPDVIRSGDFRMANTADELVLARNERVIQQIAWPGDVCCREGQVHFLEDGVWDPRPLLLGQSRFAPATFDDITVVAFVSPDCARDVLDATLSGAESSIRFNVYEFTDPGIAGMLEDARRRGVAVTVLLEGGPVGGISDEEKGIARTLADCGASVLQMGTTDAAHAKYRFDHAKYCIVDDKGVFITSENLKPTGFPAAGERGNRGWGAYLEDARVAAYFGEVFAHDAAGGDITPYRGAVSTVDVWPGGAFEPEFAPVTVSGVRVTAVLSPDTSHLVPELIAGAESSIDIEQAYISNWSANAPNPFLDAAIDAARRGVQVRVLLDSFYYNIEGDNDNDEMAAFINGIAEREILPLEARCADLDANNVVKIHNKGVIVDGTRVLVSSINWNENSPCFNREAGVILEHPDIGAYYTAVFEDDWHAGASSAPFGTGGIGPVEIRMAIAAGVLFALVLLYARRRRG